MITEDYVSYETAKLLKEKGFPLPSTNFEDWVFCMYDENGDIQWGCYHPDYYCRVTLQMAMKWLREVHNTFISIIYENDGVFVANLKSPLKGVDCMIDNKHNCWLTYEEACEAGIKYALENLI